MSILKTDRKIIKTFAFLPIFIITIFFIIAITKKDVILSILTRSYLNQYKYIIHIVIDGLSSDRLDCYGYDLKTSPTIDELAKESIVFKNAICQRTSTLPSLVSVLTSTYPLTNGILSNGIRALVPLQALPEFLAHKGYKIFFIDNWTEDPLMHPTFGDLFGEDRIFKKKIQQIHCDSTTIEGVGDDFNKTDRALSFLETNKDIPFYLFAIYGEVHDFREDGNKLDDRYRNYYNLFVDKDYNGKFKAAREFWRGEQDLSTDDKRYARSFHDAKIRFVDDQIKVLIDKLKELNMWEQTIFIIHADHGDNIYDYDLVEEKHTIDVVRTLYDKGIRVPLIIKIPFYRSKVIDQQVELIDLVPTLIDIMRLSFTTKINRKSEGISMLPLMVSENKKFSKKYAYTVGCNRIYSIRTNEWKYIHIPGYGGKSHWVYHERGELYDLKKDPYEANDLSLIRIDKRDKMKDILNKWYKEKSRDRFDFTGHVPSEVKRFMEETGYNH